MTAQPSFTMKKSVGPWERITEAEYYSGDDLFFLIDGGADLFLEYGFQHVGVASYSKTNNMVRVEVYQMNNAESSWGVFSARRPFPSLLGSDACKAFGNGYLMAVKGSFYFVLSAENKSDSVSMLSSFYNQFSADFQGYPDYDLTSFPLADSLFDIHGVAFVGRAGFSSVYSLGFSNFQQFSKGYAIRSTNLDQIKIILIYNEEQAAKSDFDSFGLKATLTDRFSLVNKSNESILLKDRDKKMLEFVLSGNSIYISVYSI